MTTSLREVSTIIDWNTKGKLVTLLTPVSDIFVIKVIRNFEHLNLKHTLTNREHKDTDHSEQKSTVNDCSGHTGVF